jgi:thiol peroxidase
MPASSVTFQGSPLTLSGEPVQPGQKAPDFTVLDTDLNEVSLSDLAGGGRTLVLVTVPSVDTSVCDTEVRRFNEEAASMSDDIHVAVVSMDLPFAQGRWCGAAGIENVKTYSDHRDASFGKAWGVLVQELRLLARAIFIVREGKVAYTQLVGEIAEEPDYQDVLSQLR